MSSHGWRDARPAQRLGLLLVALREHGSITHAAKALGISRQHVYRVLRAAVTRGDIVTPGDTVTQNASLDGVTRSDSVAWTSGRSDPTFPDVDSAPVETAEELVNVEVYLPRSSAEWLEDEAMRRKRATGASRLAKSPIVVELIEAERRRRGEGGAR